MNFVESVKKFNEIGGNHEVYNPKMMTFYMGMVLEEAAEMLEAFVNKREDGELTDVSGLQMRMEQIGNKLKEGDYIGFADGADHIEVVDGGIDVGVVGLGLVMATGFDVIGSSLHVADSNLSKYVTETVGEFKVLKNEHGKILKGEKYFRPNLAQFKH